MPTASARHFLDSNIVLYLLSADAAKANCAEQLVEQGSVISVQVLNESTHIMRRKLGLSWEEIHEIVESICAVCTVEALTVGTHDTGRRLAARYGLSVYDAMIAAAALLAGCDILFSEDMHHGLLIDGRLRVVNPFAAA